MPPKRVFFSKQILICAFRDCSDVTLNGYHIPTGAQIIPLQHFVHNDPNLWDEPEAFKPERFINAEGKVKKPDCFLPFGVGKSSSSSQ